MSKFGELINVQVPVLFEFYASWEEEVSVMTEILRDVAAAMGDKAKVIKIDIDKNKELSEALKIKGLPTLIVYKNGEMVWRQSGQQDANTLIALLQQYI